MIVINKESFDLNDIKEINLSGKWYLKMGIGIKSIEGFSIIFNNNIEKVFFDKMYSNSSDIKLFLEQFVLKQKKINNIVSENNFGEYINQYENEEIFKGNLLFCFDGILFWLVLMIFIYFMFFNGFDSKQLTLYLIFGCFAISWLIFMPRNLNYFSLTNEHLIIRNHIFFWKKKKYNLKNLKIITSTGSPLVKESFVYVYEKIKKDVHLGSISGGTDVVGVINICNPFSNIYAGEIQCPSLGIDVDVFDENGNSTKVGENGELVIKKPFPSMPVMFWNDKSEDKILKAYFKKYKNIETFQENVLLKNQKLKK